MWGKVEPFNADLESVFESSYRVKEADCQSQWSQTYLALYGASIKTSVHTQSNLGTIGKKILPMSMTLWMNCVVERFQPVVLRQRKGWEAELAAQG